MKTRVCFFELKVEYNKIDSELSFVLYYLSDSVSGYLC